MRAVINGRRWDTENPKTEKVWQYAFGHLSDFKHFEFGLYRTSHGNWFIAGSGGAMSMFGRQCGQNEWSGGERLIPFSSVETLLDWVDEYQHCNGFPDSFFDYPEIAAAINEA